jgi:hypothetical protein
MLTITPLMRLVVHLGFDIFKLVTIAMVTVKVEIFLDLIVMKIHMNDP